MFVLFGALQAVDATDFEYPGKDVPFSALSALYSIWNKTHIEINRMGKFKNTYFMCFFFNNICLDNFLRPTRDFRPDRTNVEIISFFFLLIYYWVLNFYYYYQRYQ